MDYYERTLRDFLEHDKVRKHPLHIMLRVVSAIKEIHKLGFAHYDIKASNIMLTERYQPVIVDFGLTAGM